jgi:hypothetical protein
MVQKPRTLGSITPELLSHSLAPHFEPFFGILRPKFKVQQFWFCSQVFGMVLFGAIGRKPQHAQHTTAPPNADWRIAATD